MLCAIIKLCPKRLASDIWRRVCHDKGLHLLVEACERLAEREEFAQLELHAAGYLGAGDRKYLQDIEQRVASGPLAGRFQYIGEPDRQGKIAFLQQLHVFSTPTVYRESKGLPALEAMANGVPVVLPNHGSFPEMIEQSGGGLLHQPEDVDHLADTIAQLLTDPARAIEHGRAGRRAIERHYHSEEMARRSLQLYEELSNGAEN